MLSSLLPIVGSTPPMPVVLPTRIRSLLGPVTIEVGPSISWTLTVSMPVPAQSDVVAMCVAVPWVLTMVNVLPPLPRLIVERLEAGVGHRPAGAEDPHQRRRREDAGVRRAVGRVVDGDDVAVVGARPAVDRHVAADRVGVALDVEELVPVRVRLNRRHLRRVPEAGPGADVDGVVATVGVDRRRAAHVPDGDAVVVRPGVDRGQAGVRRLDRDEVVAAPERQRDRGEAVVEDVGRQPAGAGDGDPLHGLGDLDVVGRRVVLLLAAAVEQRLVAEREHGLAAGVLRLDEAAARGGLHPDRVAAAVEHRADVRHDDLSAAGEAGGTRDPERVAADDREVDVLRQDHAADADLDGRAGDGRRPEDDRHDAAGRRVVVRLVLRLCGDARGVGDDGVARGQPRPRDREHGAADGEVSGDERRAADDDRDRVTGERRREQ